ncbi:MAG: sigma 54-interacting transcriptional regulator [Desulfobacteraceae bacterium]|nr:sigma 54-interacting transcriptional regulator [Desulfobacteraceae bacterium]
MKLPAPHVTFLRNAAMEEFILGCDAMHAIMKVVNQVAPFDVNILLTGESGTGKELLAKIIHLLSPRAENSFVPVNCGVLSGLIFEDKLFGHEKGAFTGAVAAKKGCFELAHRGTLFLDEVSELPYENQVDFLRVLGDYTFQRIGATESITVDVRLISATNRNLKEMIRNGDFREDLFYRIQVVPIEIPPLRERREVIPKMVDHFLNRMAAKYKRAKPDVSPEVMDILLRYDWPGNVRELSNLVERVFIVNEKACIDTGCLPSDFLWHFRDPPEDIDLHQVRKDAETRAILQALYRTVGDREKAAQMLKISPRTLRYKLKAYSIRVDRNGRPQEGPPPS